MRVFQKDSGVYKRTFVFYHSDPNRLEVWKRYGVVGSWDYPITFTIRECVEDWCEEQGNHLVDFKISLPNSWDSGGIESGLFKYIKS